MASKLSEPSTAIVGYIRLNPPTMPSSTSVITQAGDQREEEQHAGDDRPDDRDVEQDPADAARTTPITSTISSGMSGAKTKERNLSSEKRSAWRTEIFSSRATWTAAMRQIAPPKIAQIRRNRAEDE